MAVRIRLSRTGKRNAPSFRIVVADARAPRDGKTLEVLGHFNPSSTPPAFSFDKKRLEYWKACGAKMSRAVERLIAGEYKFKPYKPKQKDKKSESE